MSIDHTFNEIDITKPPPPVDDSFPHPKLLEQLRLADECLVRHFLSTLAAKNASDGGRARSTIAPMVIPAYRQELCTALEVLKNLEHSHMVLKALSQAENSLNTEWNDELARTEQLQGMLLSMLDRLEDTDRMHHLTNKLANRRKKRAWQKRRNARLRENQAAEQAARVQRLLEISMWETHWKERLEQERIARKDSETQALILNNVRRRKAKAKRFLQRFEKTLQLYQQRYDAKEEGDDHRIEHKFRSKITSLITQWKEKLDLCIKEEKHLKDALARRSVGNECRRRQNRWRKALFGSAAMAKLSSSDRSKKDRWRNIFATRWAWDQFAVPTGEDLHGCSSVVPSAWNLPPEFPTAEWAVYQEVEKTKKRKKCTFIQDNSRT